MPYNIISVAGTRPRAYQAQKRSKEGGALIGTAHSSSKDHPKTRPDCARDETQAENGASRSSLELCFVRFIASISLGDIRSCGWQIVEHRLTTALTILTEATDAAAGPLL